MMTCQLNDQINWRSISVFGVFLALVLGVSQAFPEVGDARESDEAAVRGVLLSSALGFAKNDVALVTKAWVNDETLSVFESGHANYGWADYRDHHLLPEMKEFKNAKYELSNIKIHLAGKTAWATFKYTISGDVEEGSAIRHVEGAGLGTAVLESRQGQWRIVHWHSSAPRRAPVKPASN